MRRCLIAPVLLVVALLTGVLAACGTNTEQDASQQPQGAALRITLGTQEFPEAMIIGELWREALAVNGYTVNLRKAVGPAERLDQQLKDGELDGYVAYTGTVLSIVAGEEISGLDPEEALQRTRDFYAGQDMVTSDATPFQNTDAVAVDREYARQHRLKEIGDLRDVDSVRFGARPEFEDLHLGLKGLQDVYGLDNLEFEPLELGTQYTALDDDRVDAVDAFTTDPQLESGDYTLLKDPDYLFGSQQVVMVVGTKKLDSIDSEAFMTVVNAVNAQLTEDAMVSMNAKVTAGRDEHDVAVEFLRSVGLNTPMDLSD